MVADRLKALDGLRGLAACVIAFVYHPLLEFDLTVMARASAPVTWLKEWGWTVVDLFFLISGYIFAHVYLSRGGIRRTEMADFAVARIARLYPLHLLMLLLTAVVFAGATNNTWPAFVAHLFMMQAFVGEVSHTFDGPSWSISVEVVCYAVFVLAAVRGDRALRCVTGGAIVVALVHFAVQGRGGGPWVGDGVPRGLLGFFLGQVLWRRRADLARVPTTLLVLGLAQGLCVDIGAVSSLLPVSLLAWPCALCLALRMPALASRPLLWLGDRSYAVYLIHFPILLAFAPSIAAARSGWAGAAVTLGYAALVLLVSDLAYRLYEMPARDAVRSAWKRLPGATAGAAREPA
jgi:peptidoglycan/LPS O-acetylase OafA/YrhL